LRECILGSADSLGGVTVWRLGGGNEASGSGKQQREGKRIDEGREEKRENGGKNSI
jgi:hypothetical protein